MQFSFLFPSIFFKQKIKKLLYQKYQNMHSILTLGPSPYKGEKIKYKGVDFFF